MNKPIDFVASCKRVKGKHLSEVKKGIKWIMADTKNMLSTVDSFMERVEQSPNLSREEKDNLKTRSEK